MTEMLELRAADNDTVIESEIVEGNDEVLSTGQKLANNEGKRVS